MNSSEASSGIYRSRVIPVFIQFLKRKKFIINRSLQFRLLALALCYALFFTFSLAALLFTPLMVQLDAVNPQSSEAANLATSILYLHNKYWLTVLLILVVISLHSILTSHRIAGPLYRFNLAFKDIERGKLPKPIQLRKGDYLTDEMNQINGMIASLRKKFEELNRLHGEVDTAIAELNQDPVTVSPEELSLHLKNLESKNRELREKLSEFEIKS